MQDKYAGDLTKLIEHEIEYLEWDINERYQRLCSDIDLVKEEIALADISLFVNIMNSSTYKHIISDYERLQEMSKRKIWLVHLLDRAHRGEVVE